MPSALHTVRTASVKLSIPCVTSDVYRTQDRMYIGTLSPSIYRQAYNRVSGGPTVTASVAMRQTCQ